MTDKEQIIIDGVDVSGCSYYNPLGNYNCGGTKKCSQWSNCYFKQLSRKTAECEELKKEIKKLTTEYYRENLHNVDLAFKNYQIEKANQRQTKIANDLGKNMLKYEQALNEIEKQARINCEEICGKNYDTCKDRDCLTTLLKDIISKAKDGKNE